MQQFRQLSPGVVVSWSVTATNSAPLTSSTTGTTYIDQYLSVSATPVTASVCPNVPISVKAVINNGGGYAINLNGTNQYVEVPQSAGLNMSFCSR